MALTNLMIDFPGLGGPPTFGQSWENKYLYPSFEEPSGTVTVATNLFPNPDGMSVGAPVEVWRNHFTNPGQVGGGPSTLVPGWQQNVFRPGAEAIATAIAYSANLSLVSGGSVGALITVRSDVAQSITIALRETKAGSFGVQPTIQSKTVALVAGVETDISLGGVVSAPDSDGYRVYMPSASAPVAIKHLTLMHGVTVAPVKVGPSSTDPDLTFRFLGTPNNSQSVLEGLPPVGWAAGGACRAIRSQAGGVRVIRTGVGDAYVLLTVTVSGARTGIIKGTPGLSGTARPYLTATGGTAWMDEAEPGVYRVTTPATGWSGPTYMIVRPDVSGSTNIGAEKRYEASTIVAGAYDGPPFSGNTPDAGDFEYAWSGAENNSPSIMRARGLPGVVPGNGRLVFQSQEWAAEGQHSLRIRPLPGGSLLQSALGASLGSFASHGFSDGDTVTIVAVVHLASPQFGTLHANARTVGIYLNGYGWLAVSDPAPNVAGDHVVRLTYVIGDAAETIRLAHGADSTNDDIWWDMLTIVPGVYTGPPFSGDSQIPGYFMEWLGTPDESASTLTEVQTHENRVKEVVSWSITEPGTPHNIAQSNGSTGSAQVTAKAKSDSFWTISEPAEVTVEGLSGNLTGTVSNVRLQPFHEHGEPGGAVTVDVASVLTLLNAERTLPPVMDQPLSDVFRQYVAAVTPNLQLTWLASADPTRTYGAWTGVVWEILKTLCAANRVEMALSGGQLLVRDIGTQILRLDGPAQPGLDVESVSVAISPGTGQYVELISRNSVGVDNQATYNYVQNPSVEVDASGYGVRTLAFGAIQGSRVTN